MVRKRFPRHSSRSHLRKFKKAKHSAKDKHIGARSPRFKTVNAPHNIW